jgi:hypothetical protein
MPAAFRARFVSLPRCSGSAAERKQDRDGEDEGEGDEGHACNRRAR